MKNNKFTEIRNRAAYVQDLMNELTEAIKEAELSDAINTKQTIDEEVHMVDATVNDLEGYEVDEKECKPDCITKIIIGAAIGLLILVYFLYK